MTRKQDPKIAIKPETKSIIEARKPDNQTYDTFLKSLVSNPTQSIYSLVDTSTSAPIVGAAAGEEAFASYRRILRWIQDTRKKLPTDNEDEYNGITPEQREEAFNLDPLVNGIISPYLKNILLSKYNIITDDNDKYQDMIDEIEEYITELKFMQVARDDFDNYAVKHGHSYWRKDYNGDKISRLQVLDSKSIKTYVDPWNSDIVAYHQHIYIQPHWTTSSYAHQKETNSWFIPDGEIYIPDEGIEDPNAKEIWTKTKEKYGITDTNGLRVGAAEDIIAMHRVKPGDPAPIDAAMLAIWLKRLVLTNSPNLIFNVLMPFMHLKQGLVTETTDVNGNKRLITTVPQTPPASMATTDPEGYTAATQAVTNYQNALKTNLENILRYRGESGLLASGPDLNLEVKESAGSISPAFIQTMITQLNEDISHAFSFPMALIQARGAELATSDTIKNMFTNSLAGVKQDYEYIANNLITEAFQGRSWTYELEQKDGTVERGKYSFEETKCQFVLGDEDKTDVLKEAQTHLVTMQMLQIAKGIGASKNDITAVLDEKGMGLWELDGYDSASQLQPLSNEKETEMQEIKTKAVPLPSELQIPPVSKMMSTVTDANNEDEKLFRDIMKTYMMAKESLQDQAKHL